MTKEQAEKELSIINKIDISGWTIDEIADIQRYKNYLKNIIKRSK